MTELEQVFSIAVDTRKICEALTESEVSDDMDFSGDSDSLTAMCACASWILKNELRRNGIASLVLAGEFVDDNGQLCGGHCWVKYKDWYIDLTVRQFSEWFDEDPEFDHVTIFHHKNDTHISDYYQNGRVARSFATFADWPDSQDPAYFVTKPEVKKFIKEYRNQVAA